MVFYHQFPLWRNFFEELGFRVVLSRPSDRVLVTKSLEMLSAETCFPIEDPAIQKRILAECRLYLTDNCQAWQLGSDGLYQRVQSTASGRRSAQETLLEEIAGT